MGKHWLILDSNYLCHRAKWAMGHLAHGNKPTGVVFGFLQTTLDLWDEFRPSGMVFCFDSKRLIRQQLYPAYKAKRRHKLDNDQLKFEVGVRHQIKQLRSKYLHRIGFHNVLIQSGYEADDLIASVCSTIKAPDMATIVSGDHDLYGLIGRSNIEMYDLAQRRVMNLSRFQRTFGINPSQWPMVKAIAGCSSDNIPGIAGVGQKTAIKYLTGALDESRHSYKMIVSGRDKIDLFLRLIELPMEGAKVPGNLQTSRPSRKGWIKICRQLGFWSLMRRLDNQGGNRR